MKFQAPAGVTMLFVAGENIRPDADGRFEAPSEYAEALGAHGCAALPETQPLQSKSASRARSEKAD